MGNYIDPNSGRAPQPGGRAGTSGPITAPTIAPPTSDSLTAAAERAQRDIEEAAGEEEPEGEPQSMEATTQGDEVGIRDLPEPENEDEGEGEKEPELEPEESEDEPSEEGEDEDDEGDDGESGDRLDDLSRDDLIEIATQHEITGRHQMNRQDLIEAIRSTE